MSACTSDFCDETDSEQVGSGAYWHRDAVGDELWQGGAAGQRRGNDQQVGIPAAV